MFFGRFFACYQCDFIFVSVSECKANSDCFAKNGTTVAEMTQIWPRKVTSYMFLQRVNLSFSSLSVKHTTQSLALLSDAEPSSLHRLPVHFDFLTFIQIFLNTVIHVFMKTRRAPTVSCFIADYCICSFYFQTSENCLSSPLTGPMVTAVPLLVVWSSQMDLSIVFLINLSRHSRLHACRYLVMWYSSGDSHLSSTPPPVTRLHALLFVCLFVC